MLCSNSFLGLLLAEGLVLFFAFEAHGMMIRSVNPNLQLEQGTSASIDRVRIVRVRIDRVCIDRVCIDCVRIEMRLYCPGWGRLW